MPKVFTRLVRFIHIFFILARYNLDGIILANSRFYPLRYLTYLNPAYWTIGRRLSAGERIRRAVEQLGPIFIKAGQILSTRLDFLPEEIVIELTLLQDRVAPFPGKLAKQMVEEALKCPIAQVFSHFDLEPLAAASIAQVHAATLNDGRAAVVKILRPNIKQIIDRDIDLLMTLARLAERYWRGGRSFKPVDIVQEIAQTLYDELDLLREGANASQLRRNFLYSPLLHIPEIYWAYSRTSVLVMERIYGIPINDIEQLRRSGVDLKQVAERGIDIFFTQVLRDNFFHADLHPGNLFISVKDLEDPQYIAVDFGIAGSLSTRDQRYLAENMLAFLKRDYGRVAELHIASGWLPPETRSDQFEGAIRAVCEPIFELPLSEISFGQLLLRLFQTARRFHINIQPQLILLQKSLLSMESLSRQLYPDIDLWKTVVPYLEHWLKRQVGVRSFFKRIQDNLPLWAERMPEIPNLVFEILDETRLRKEKQRFFEDSQPQVDKPLAAQNRAAFWRGSGLGLMLTAGALWLLPFYQAEVPWVSWLTGGTGLVVLLAGLLNKS